MNLPLAIVDYRLPEEAISRLRGFAKVCLFNAKGLTFDAVSGHPDIFICQVDNKVVVAPNIPQYLIDIFNLHHISFLFGNQNVGFDVSSSTRYNCLVTNDLMLHKRGCTDTVIQELCSEKRQVDLPQPFTRCSLFSFSQNLFITSDKGIYNVLVASDLQVCFVDPIGILLSPYKNGFIGGCLGILGNKVFLSGSIAYLNDGMLLKDFILDNGFELVELYDGPLIDVGGIFFL